MKLLIATVWAYPGRPIDESPLWQSCRALGLPLFVSQQGEKCGSLYDHKIVRFGAEISQFTWDLVLYVDGDDAFLTRRPAGLAELLRSYDTEFLVSSETICWPWANRHAHRYPATIEDGHGPGRFANAGVWLATRAAWNAESREMMRFAESGDPYRESGIGILDTDQHLFHERALAADPRMKVDTSERLALTIQYYPAPRASVRRRVIMRNAPLVVHGPGVAKDFARSLFRDCARLDALRGDSLLESFGLNACKPDPATGWPTNMVDELLEVARALPPMQAVAILGGTNGIDAAALSMLAESVFAIDRWPSAEECAAALQRIENCDNVQTFRGDVGRAAGAFPDRHFDLIVVHPNLANERAAEVLRLWLPKARPGGWFVARDLPPEDHDFLRRALGNRVSGKPRIGAYNAWIVGASG